MAFSPDMKDIIGNRFVVLDLDAVITDDMTPLFLRNEEFVICQGTAPRTPYNSSMILMTAGKRSQVWSEFDKQKIPEFIKQTKLVGTDQAWISACLGPNEATWGPNDGVLSFHNHVIKEDRLPANAKIVFFQGKYDPSHKNLQAKHPWIVKYWENGQKLDGQINSSKANAAKDFQLSPSMKFGNSNKSSIVKNDNMSLCKRRIFIDCGAYNGNSVRKFISAFNNFEIFSFEPNPIFVKQHDQLPNKLFPVAIWIKDGAISFYIDEKDFDGSSVYKHKLNIEGKTKLDVPCIDFSKWVRSEFRKEDFIILKMDIEGAEYQVLEKMIIDGTIAYIDELLIEFHWDKIGMKQEVHDRLVHQIKSLGIHPVEWDACGWDYGNNSGSDLLYLVNKYPQLTLERHDGQNTGKFCAPIYRELKMKSNVPVGRQHSPSFKLTFVANDPDQHNGPNIWLQRILPELVRRGFSVQIIFLLSSKKSSKVADRLKRHGVECLFLELKPSTEEIIQDLLEILQQNPPDAYIPNLSVPAYYAARWIKAAGIPTIGIIRSDDTFHHELVEYFVNGEPAYRLSGVVCKSLFLQNYVQSHNPDGLPTLCSASGTMLPTQTASSPGDTLEIVFTGRLVQRQKRIYDVVYALKRVVTEIPGCRAHVYGEDREGGKVMKMIEELKLGEKLTYGGLIPFEKIYPTLQAHHVFVLLSDYEGMSTSLMEAMACGLVPICTRTRSGAMEIITHNENGLLVDNRGDDVVAAIRRLKEEEGLWQRLSLSARETIADRYTVEKGAEKWTNFLTKLIQVAGPKRTIEVPALQNMDLPALRYSDNGISREDVRMAKWKDGNGQEFSPFLKPPLSPDNMDLYSVRSSILRALNEFLPRCRGTILDVGCGQMPYRSVIEPKAESYLGLDILNPSYQQSIKPDLVWDGKSIAMKSFAVDCALATELFEHLPDPLAVLQEIYRVLKPGGLLFFTVPFLWPLHDIPYDEYRYTPFSLKRNLESAGFENIDIKPLGGWNASLAQMIGLWINRSGLPECDRKKYAEQFFPLYRDLIESDKTTSNFSSQAMFTGLYGTASKKKRDSSKAYNFNIASISNEKLAVFSSENHSNPVQDNCLAIFTPCVGATSETFITNHIRHLLPEKTVVVTGKVEDGSWLKSPIKCIPFTDTPSHYRPEVENEILDFMVHHKVTHILCEYGCAGTEIVILNQQLLHLPIFVHFHGYDVSQEMRKPQTVKYYRWMGDNVTGVITDTRIQKQRLVEIGIKEDKITIIPYGVVVQDRQADVNISPCRFICVSRLVPKKGPILLLKSFCKARKLVPVITLDIVGDGPLMEKVQTYIAKENLKSSVRIHGAKSNDFVKNLLCESSVYVQHSVTDSVSGDAEGLPVAILEAAAAGLPVVSTLHEGIPDEVEHGVTGYLVKEFDVDTMAMYMVKLAHSHELRKSMGMAARKKIKENFSLEREINSLRILMGLSDSYNDGGKLQRACSMQLF